MRVTPLEIAREPRRLGKSDLHVGPVAYGLWRFAGTGVAEARAKVETALDEGMTLLDTADIYGEDGASEALLGRVFAEAPRLRERAVLATKCGIVPGVPYDSSAAYVRGACEASLRRLRTDVIDLYQIHRPDWLTHPQEVAGALAELRQRSLVREVGVSNHTTAQLEALQAHLPFPIATTQPEWSALCLNPLRDGVADQCMRLGITPLAWSPLAGGLLSLPPEEAAARPRGGRLAGLIRALDAKAASHGVSREAVALAFVMVHPAGAIPIVGTQRLPRIRACREVFSVRLSRSDWYELVEASLGERLP
jgi:aryl-alcohol dehydrogenase-like predicted oxidoreductase